MDGKETMPTNARPDTRFTYDDFLLFPDDGKRHEIIDGDHYVTPSPNRDHQDLLGRLHLAIGNFLATRRHLGRVFLADHVILTTPLLPEFLLSLDDYFAE